MYHPVFVGPEFRSSLTSWFWLEFLRGYSQQHLSWLSWRTLLQSSSLTGLMKCTSCWRDLISLTHGPLHRLFSILMAWQLASPREDDRRDSKAEVTMSFRTSSECSPQSIPPYSIHWKWVTGCNKQLTIKGRKISLHVLKKGATHD